MIKKYNKIYTSVNIHVHTLTVLIWLDNGCIYTSGMFISL
jgi:hypothetical protein